MPLCAFFSLDVSFCCEFPTAMLVLNQPPPAGLSLTLIIALFGTMLHPPCAIFVCLCDPFRVCVDIVPDSALVPPEVLITGHNSPQAAGNTYCVLPQGGGLELPGTAADLAGFPGIQTKS